MMNNKVINKTIFTKLGFFFFLSYPIFDIKPFYNSFTTLARIIILMFLVFGVLLYNSKARKSFRYIIIFVLAVLIYFIYHDFNAKSFVSYVPGNFNYSTIEEFLQIVKLIMPVILLFVLKYLSFHQKEYQRIFDFWILFISGSIVISNLFTVSLGSYSDQVIKGNFFTWFSSNSSYDYMDLASKGFFQYANQITALLICLLPYLHLMLKQQFNWRRVFLMFLLSLCMLMLGTRIASYGLLLVSLVLLIFHLVFVLLKKERWHFKYAITIAGVLLFTYILLPFSPCTNRQNVTDSIVYGSSSQIQKEEKINYIAQHYQEKRIYDYFILNSYPYQYDPDFWYDILQLPVEKRIDYRYLEISMIKRIVEINHNPLDPYLGITNTRIQNVFNIERDFILQFYAFGIIGMLLLFGFYVIIAWKLGIDFLRNWNGNTVMGISTVILFLLCAYLSGNLLNHLSVVLPIVLLFYYFIDFHGQNSKNLWYNKND